MPFNSSNPNEELPDESKIIKHLDDKHLDLCFHRTLAVIDQSFLTISPGSSSLTVRQMLLNLMAIATSLHLRVQHFQLSDKDVASHIYELDSLTDDRRWVAPLNQFIGPAGGRRPKRRRTTKMRKFTLTAENGTTFEVETGKI
jgi:hypothetical protein